MSQDAHVARRGDLLLGGQTVRIDEVCVRHAQARSFRVTVEQRDNTAGLVICDDGVGFDAGRALARAVQGQSGGLLGMQERVMLCGGRLTIESSAQRGTTIRAWIPLPLESPIAAGEKEQSA